MRWLLPALLGYYVLIVVHLVLLVSTSVTGLSHPEAVTVYWWPLMALAAMLAVLTAGPLLIIWLIYRRLFGEEDF